MCILEFKFPKFRDKNGIMSAYKDICERLDVLALTAIETLEQILQNQNKITALLSDGNWLMAKSRSIMGQKAVSELQVPTGNERLTASAKIDINTSGTEDKVEMFTLVNSCDKQTDHKQRLDHTNTIRRRKLDAPSPADSAHSVDFSGDNLSLQTNENQGSWLADSNGDNASLRRDPITWFGILVPQSLRECQQRYKAAVEITVTLVNLQKKLVDLKKEYAKLMKDKQVLQHVSE